MLLRSLRKQRPDGEPYRRSEIIEEQIWHALSLTRSQLIARAKTSDHDAHPYIKAECLVYMIREYRRSKPPRFYKAADELEGILVDRCAPVIQMRVKHLLGGVNNEDACQEVFEILHRAINGLSEEGDFLEVNFSTYLQLRCSDVCRPHRKYMKDHVPLETLAGYGQHDEEIVAQYDPSLHWDRTEPSSPADFDETKEEKALVWRAIDTLSEIEKTAIVLHYFRGWPIYSKDPTDPTLCRRFDLSDHTMRRVLWKAKQKIATWLNDHEKA